MIKFHRRLASTFANRCKVSEQNAASNRTDYEELADEFQSMADMLNRYASELESEPNNGSIANIAQ